MFQSENTKHISHNTLKCKTQYSSKIHRIVSKISKYLVSTRTLAVCRTEKSQSMKIQLLIPVLHNYRLPYKALTRISTSRWENSCYHYKVRNAFKSQRGKYFPLITRAFLDRFKLSEEAGWGEM